MIGKNIVKKVITLLTFVGVGFLIGCVGGGGGVDTDPVLLPPHIRKIAVRPFLNKTQFFGLEDKLMLVVQDEFIQDGRYAYVPSEEEADGVLVGEISRYILQPGSYDENHVIQEYDLWILINIKFTDRVKDQTIWEEPRMSQRIRYFVPTLPGGLTDDEARQELWDLFARDIVRRTLEGFGSVTGESKKKVSENAPPSFPY